MTSTAFPILLAALSSFLLARLLIVVASKHGAWGMDVPGSVQALHVTPTPRVGGLGIYLAVLATRTFASPRETAEVLDTVLLAGAPALAAGLAEDMTRAVSPTLRLCATVLSGLIACGLSGRAITHLDVGPADALLAIAPLSILFTAFAVAGVANSVNIIDGLNGLASGTVALLLLCVAYVAGANGDTALMLAAITLAAASAGFLLVNFPWGRLFLGDGGAYFSGFALAWLCVLLPMRNPSVSPWVSLLICAYPVTEVLYSIVRRLGNHRSPGAADSGHLHSIVARRIVRRRLGSLDPVLQNSAVSVLMWVCAAIPALAAVTFFRSTPALALGAAAFVLLYHWLYRQVARA